MIAGATRVVAALVLSGVGGNMAKAVAAMDKAKREREAEATAKATARPVAPAPWEGEAERAARRMASSLGLADAGATKAPSLRDAYPPEAQQALVGALVGCIIGGVLNRAATVLGRR